MSGVIQIGKYIIRNWNSYFHVFDKDGINVFTGSQAQAVQYAESKTSGNNPSAFPYFEIEI